MATLSCLGGGLCWLWTKDVSRSLKLFWFESGLFFCFGGMNKTVKFRIWWPDIKILLNVLSKHNSISMITLMLDFCRIFHYVGLHFLLGLLIRTRLFQRIYTSVYRLTFWEKLNFPSVLLFFFTFLEISASIFLIFFPEQQFFLLAFRNL